MYRKILEWLFGFEKYEVIHKKHLETLKEKEEIVLTRKSSHDEKMKV